MANPNSKWRFVSGESNKIEAGLSYTGRTELVDLTCLQKDGKSTTEFQSRKYGIIKKLLCWIVIPFLWAEFIMDGSTIFISLVSVACNA